MPLMRIPYTAPLPAPTIIPASASTLPGAIAALHEFLTAPTHLVGPNIDNSPSTTTTTNAQTLLLTGAGISVASGLADYRGTSGTYTLNKTYRPIYFHEFVASHEARKRYWARSFLGWTNLSKAKPNAAHEAVGRLGELGVVRDVVTQNVDSFHPLAHPALPTLELHGYLRSAICLTCSTPYPRTAFQRDLAALNPTWATFLADVLASGALSTENPAERRRLGLKTNPDGDVDIPGVEYSSFRYPACPTCLRDAARTGVRVDGDGAWVAPEPRPHHCHTQAPPPPPPPPQKPTPKHAGILKPAVVMFGESIPGATKLAAEAAVDAASRVLVLGSSLATYSAWRLVKRAREAGKPVGIVNLGGVRGEELFFAEALARGQGPGNKGADGVRCAQVLEELLPGVVKKLEAERAGGLAKTASRYLDHERLFTPAAWA